MLTSSFAAAKKTGGWRKQALAALAAAGGAVFSLSCAANVYGSRGAKRASRRPAVNLMAGG
jgi:hypothetical protein